MDSLFLSLCVICVVLLVTFATCMYFAIDADMLET